MKNYSKFYGFLLAGAFCCTGSAAFAQDDDQSSDKGWINASFETNSIFYRKDPKAALLNMAYPKDHVASNNYLKFDYTKGRFSTGFQLEPYLPVLAGYPTELKGTKLTNLYAQWADRDFTVTGGTFYDQFGSGLLFRSYEERMLGFNNALLGARATYSYKGMVNVKALWGTPRFGVTYDTRTQVRGGDLSLSIGDMCGWNNTSLFVEGSVLNVFIDDVSDETAMYMNPNRMGYSGRINLETGGFTAKLEYVDNGVNYYSDVKLPDPDAFLRKRGNAQLIEVGYNDRGLGIFVSARRLAWMKSEILFNNGSTLNTLNYVPAMSLQHTYMLATLNPFIPQLGQITTEGLNVMGEIGGQADIYYTFRKGSTLGGKRGLKVHANFATYYSLKEGAKMKARNLTYRDLTIDFEKWFSRKFKLTMLYSMQENNHSYGLNPETELNNVIVADMIYKFNTDYSLRWELQYLFGDTNSKERDWMAALVEFNVAPKWSLYVSDMYNHGHKNENMRIHYYDAGISFAQSHTRLQLSYGRHRAGYVCSGGVCRMQPAYTGFNFAMTMTF